MKRVSLAVDFVQDFVGRFGSGERVLPTVPATDESADLDTVVGGVVVHYQMQLLVKPERGARGSGLEPVQEILTVKNFS